MEGLLPDRDIMQRFLDDDDQFPMRSTSSSWPEVPLGATHVTRGFVRVGMAVYGHYGGPSEASLLRPVATLKAQVRHIRFAKKGSPVSYDRSYRCPADCLLATLGAGYADGYPRCLANIASVEIRGQDYPIVGKICMDMMMVNLGAPDCGGGSAAGVDVIVGDYAVLATTKTGSQVDWNHLAGLANTASTEFMTQITKRVKRVYIGKPPAATHTRHARAHAVAPHTTR